MDKASIRKTMKAKRQSLSDKDQRIASARIIALLHQDAGYLSADVVAMYYPLDDEIDLLPLLDDDKTFCFPRIKKTETAEMEFVTRTDKGFQNGPFNLKEPIGTPLEKTSIDLFLVPGLAFTRHGARIGYGKGYYDHYLDDAGALKYGICHPFQIIPGGWADEDDVPMDNLLTPERMIVCIPH